WFGDLIKLGVPCGPINTVDQGVAFAEQIGLEPAVMSGHGDAAVPTVRHPLTFSVTPPRYDLPPPELGEHGQQIQAWLAGDADREQASGPSRASPRRWAPPTRTRSPCWARTWPPT